MAGSFNRFFSPFAIILFRLAEHVQVHKSFAFLSVPKNLNKKLDFNYKGIWINLQIALDVRRDTGKR